MGNKQTVTNLLNIYFHFHSIKNAVNFNFNVGTGQFHVAPLCLLPTNCIGTLRFGLAFNNKDGLKEKHNELG